MKYIYFAVLKDGSLIRDNFLEALVNISDLEYLFKFETTTERRFIPISKDGSYRKLVFGDFELEHISTWVNDGWGRNAGYTVTIKENKTGLNRQELVSPGEFEFILKGFLPFMRKLEELGSWEVYLTYKENQKLRTQNDELRTKIYQLEQEIKELKTIA